MDPLSPEWKRVSAMVEEQAKRMANGQLVLTDGFAMAFLDATGIKAQDAEMMIESKEVHNYTTGEHKVVQKIWFQRRNRTPKAGPDFY